ncbi:MAG TPA: D-alanyl-D-alanine carboxypeptidase family protein [Symbiobacteriaceae bacterium]|nr:D-alanyl-D-alanine carboxypeptidase family protein [Symbiobacteriaceae bacterium]
MRATPLLRGCIAALILVASLPGGALASPSVRAADPAGSVAQIGAAPEPMSKQERAPGGPPPEPPFTLVRPTTKPVTPGTAETDPVKLTSPSAILVDAQSGKVLYERNSHERRAPASVTKVMTLVIAFDCIREGKCKLDDKITISDEAAAQVGTIIFADTGEQFTLRELLLSIAVGSANDASIAVAEHVAGTEQGFVNLMNQRAQDLGLKDTHFANPTGLTADGHLTSAHDLAMISRYASLNYPELMKLTAVYDAKLNVPWRKNGPTFQLWNNNKLLTWYEGADGMKTGWTQAAGYCLAATAQRSGVRMISVVMGAADPKVRNAEAARLLDWGFANYTVVQVAPAGQSVGKVPVMRGEIDQIDAVPTIPFGVSVPKGRKGQISHQVQLKEQVVAPIKAGDPVGEIIALVDGKEAARAPLVAKVDVPVATYWKSVIKILLHMLKV